MIQIRSDLCNQFLGWQCRIRQHAVRKQEGQPPQGIRATVSIAGEPIGAINTVMNKLEPEQVTAEFRFMLQKTHEHQKVYDNALKFLAEYYFQYPAEFDDGLTALFAVDSELAAALLAADLCELSFSQANQQYLLKCTPELCDVESVMYQATYWHNHLFNPNLPGVVKIIRFPVDWQRSEFIQL